MHLNVPRSDCSRRRRIHWTRLCRNLSRMSATALVSLWRTRWIGAYTVSVRWLDYCIRRTWKLLRFVWSSWSYWVARPLFFFFLLYYEWRINCTNGRPVGVNFERTQNIVLVTDTDDQITTTSARNVKRVMNVWTGRTSTAKEISVTEFECSQQLPTSVR